VVDDVLARASSEFLENEFLKDDSVSARAWPRACSAILERRLRRRTDRG
jgi:hypothetical protein